MHGERAQISRPTGGCPVERYRKAGKHLRHLSPDCLELLTKAKDMVEIDVRADNKPG